MATGFTSVAAVSQRHRGISLCMCSQSVSRRSMLALVGLVLTPRVAVATDQDKALEELRKVTDLQAKAFGLTNGMNYVEAEKVWTKIIDMKDDNAAAWSNRGNCRTSQGRFDEAIADFNKAIDLAPNEPDPYLGRGVAFEGLRKYEDALKDYETANEKSRSRYGQEDPVTYNNRGNAYGGLGQWDKAVQLYQKAADMNRNYVFARANEALARYQIGDTEKSLSMMRFLVRKYPGFADIHAALAAAYWADGSVAASESEWSSAMKLDYRYKDIDWIRLNRRWPPRLVNDIENFLKLTKQK
mmetsp:Transcript_8714/g.26199  ORF Transcript_8714/g.26199 Transcript_8714/m.26199 type:complete len:299 (-) Transcript_8714:195-1091(-)